MDELPGGVLRVTMPLPMRPGHVHCYLLPVDGGFMVVDTGLGLPDATERWAAELAQLDGPVVRLLITHFHPDHLGAAADVRDLTGARVYQGRVDATQARRAWESDDWSQVLADWFHRNGVPEAATQELIEQGSLYQPFIRTVADPELIAHHHERLDATVAALSGEPATGYDVSYPLFGAELEPAARRFAVAETLSHLERLVLEGRAICHEDVDRVSYTAP